MFPLILASVAGSSRGNGGERGQTGSLIFKCLVRGGRGAQWDTAEPSAANKVE